MIVLDFETEEIKDKPDYPPAPVGVALLWNGVASYLAWGHPTGNNCTPAKGRQILEKVWASGEAIVMHHAAFDIAVARKAFNLPELPWQRVHDTMFLLFLTDPHSRDLGLKPAAERLLGMPPDERDAVRDWLVDYGFCKRNDKKWGRFISQAPGDLVGKYAVGDVVRTARLFKLLYKEVKDRGMKEAYDRERKVMPILMRNEEVGMRLDVERLRKDLDVYTAAKDRADRYLKKRLGDINIDSDAELADALEYKGIVTEWKLTKTGRRSTAKGALTPQMFSDQRVAQALGYRNRLATCIGTFMEPWLERSFNGRLSTTWNQVRSTESGGSGTRTGRPSTNRPNFLNIPKTFSDKNDGYVHPEWLRVPELPLMRRYILPDEGGVFLHRDFNQQELRILAHFEDGILMERYNDQPDMDIHTYVGELISAAVGHTVQRRAVKILNFGMVYGMGLGKLAEGLALAIDEAKKLKDAQMAAIPGLKHLNSAIRATVRAGEPIRTWGGREYYVEPPKMKNGRMMDFTYKLMNYLIQGSAADFTKEALIRYDATKVNSRFLVTVYDEINISAPKRHVKEEMEILRIAMEDVPGLDVPMLSDGKSGPNWGELEKYND